MFSHFFIRRPIFASVLSIVTVLLGAIAVLGLPIMQYPRISPPVVQVTATYPGANAEDVERTVATPIEQQVNGAKGMLYMSSKSSADGVMTLDVTFGIDTDIDLDAVEVQNRVALAQPLLPTEVTRQGLSVKKRSPDFLQVISIYSPDGSRDALFLSNYATINLIDALARVPGVGDTMVGGAGDYAMRIWLDPNKLTNMGMTATDVAAALREQNLQAPAGRIGDPPMASGQQFEYTVRVKGRLTEVAEFENIILRTKPDGTQVRVRDVARVELAAKSYTSYSRINGNPSASIILFQLPGSNALDVVKQVGATMEELSKSFPPGVAYSTMYDSTKFVRASLEEVLKTLFEAMLLVFLVTYLFLQSWRATIIPCLAAPVSLIGTFVFFQLLDISINTVSMFGLVLAIGLVVDDAIVVVEAVKRHMEDDHLPAPDAARAAMSAVTGPIVATTLVLFAVFAPVAFLGGIAGQLYKQFAVTVCVSVAISAFNSLTLSPALCALLLKAEAHGPKVHRGPLALFFAGFNRIFDLTTRGYMGVVHVLIRRSIIVIVALVIAGVGCWNIFKMLPGEFVPDEDQGVFLVDLRLPQGASQERTKAISERVEKQCLALPGVSTVLCIGGQSFMTGSRSSNVNSLIVTLKPWSERTTPETQLKALMAQAQQQLAAERDAQIMVFTFPSVPGMGSVSAAQFELQDRAGRSPQELVDTARRFIGTLMTDQKNVGMAFTSFNADTPQIDLQLDRDKAKLLNIPINDIFDTLNISMGGLYVNDINKFGRTYRVQLEAESWARRTPEDIRKLYVRAGNGEMVPMSTLATVGLTNGPDMLTRYNLYRTAEILAMPPPGASTGPLMDSLKSKAVQLLPAGYGFEWTGLSYQQAKASSQIAFILIIAVTFVFLTLAAQYESWIVPFAVILAIPVGVLGALVSQLTRGVASSVYAQIGLVMLIGLAAKNAILIVEYARERYTQGMPLVEATLEAARLRFRPILMTSFAFIMGLFPLVISTGAGAAARQALGTVVLGGMLIATGFGVFIIPTLYVLAERLGKGLRIHIKPQDTLETEPTAAGAPAAAEDRK
jgi:HAE1 family hydrophobic/amphiphilic exporter-1/multidrug efflux pump